MTITQVNNDILRSATMKIDIARLKTKDPKHIAELNKGDELLRAHWRLIQTNVASVHDLWTKPARRWMVLNLTLTASSIETVNGEAVWDLIRRINGNRYVHPLEYCCCPNASPNMACTFAAYSDDDL